MPESISLAEKHDLHTLEKKIASSKEAFFILGIALTAIRDRRLYRAKFDTFEEYCQVRWGWSRQRAYQLMESSEVVDSLAKDGQPVALETERAAREMAKVPLSHREEVIDTAIKDNAGAAPTAAAIAKAAAKVAAKKPLADEGGYLIPRDLLALWDRRLEIRQMMRTVAHLRKVILDNRNSDDKLYLKINQSVLDKLAAIYHCLKEIKPAYVCGICQGRLEIQPDGACKACGSTGFMSKYEYETFVPIEIRVMRKRNVETEKLPVGVHRVDPEEVGDDAVDIGGAGNGPR